METNIVEIGGGGGVYRAAKGLRRVRHSRRHARVTLVCTGSDSGGSSRIIQEDFGWPGYVGDLTKGIAGLCPDENLEKYLLYRHKKGFLWNPFYKVGHSNKNNELLGMLEAFEGNLEIALPLYWRRCGIEPHRAFPATASRTTLVAQFKDGTIVREESEIDKIYKAYFWKVDNPIVKVWLDPPVPGYPPVIEILRGLGHNDIIALGPGDLWTSTIPALLPEGISEAVRDSRAKLVLLANLVTKKGETDNYEGEDFLRVTEKQVGRACDFIVFHNGEMPENVKEEYKKEDKVQFRAATWKNDHRFVGVHDLGIATPEGAFCHNPEALARAIRYILRTEVHTHESRMFGLPAHSH